MKSGWNPSPAELDAYAVRHIEYETRMLLHQVAFLHTRFEGGTPTDARGDALIEAALVHLRLFDSFFRNEDQHEDDVVARHWDPSWQPRGVLTREERKEINAHAHLSARRGPAQLWQQRLPGMALTLCDCMSDFVKGLPAPRRKAFAAPLLYVAQFREWKKRAGL